MPARPALARAGCTAISPLNLVSVFTSAIGADAASYKKASQPSKDDEKAPPMGLAGCRSGLELRMMIYTLSIIGHRATTAVVPGARNELTV